MAVALAETGYSFRGAKRLHLMSVHRSEPMLLVGDVQGSVAWYCRLLDCQADHGLEEFDRLRRTVKSCSCCIVENAPCSAALLDSKVAGNGFVL